MHKNYLNAAKGMLLIAFLLFFNNIYALTIAAGASGNWNAGTTWVGGIVPGPGDDVTITGNFIVTVPAGTFACANISVTGKATAPAGTSGLVINGTLNASGIVTVTGGGAAARIGDITLTPGGVFNIGSVLLLVTGTGGGANNSTFNSGGALTVAGDINIGSGAGASNAVLYPQGGTIDVNGDVIIQGPTGYGFITFNAPTIFNVNGNASTFDMQAFGTVNMGSGGSTLNVAGNLLSSGGTFTPGDGTVNYFGNAAQTITALNYYNLTSSSTGARTLAPTGTIGVSNIFTPGTNAYVNTNSTINFNGTGAQTIPAFDYFNLTSSSTGARTWASTGVIGVAGALVLGTNAYTITGSTVNFNGAAAQTVPAQTTPTTPTYNNITITKPAGIAASTVNNNSILISGNATVISGTFAVGTGLVVVGQLAEYTFAGNPGSSILEVKDGAKMRLIGTSAFASNFPTGLWSNIILNSNSDFDYASVLGQNIVAYQYGNLMSASTAGTRTLAPAGNIKIAGAFTPNTPTISYTITGSTVEYNGAVAQTIAPFNYNNLLVTNVAANMTLSGTAGVADTFTPNTLAFASNTGTIDYNGATAQNIIAFNYFNLTSSSTGARTLARSGIIKVAANLTSGNTNTFTLTGSTVEFNGASAQALTGILGDAADVFNNLTINNTGTLITDGLNLSTSINVGGVLDMMNGYLTLNANKLTVTNPAATAITRTNGVIVSENTANGSKLQWNIGTSLGAHLFPFGKTLAEYIPVNFNLTAGDASNITISTYPTALDNTPLPTTPTTVTGIDKQGATDALNKVVDRFWQIDPSTAVARTATITFTYTSGETPVPTPAAQRWNGSAWDAPIVGQTSTATSVTVAGVNAFTAFAVYDQTIVVPVTLTGFKATAVNNKYVKITWETANEININHYEIERGVSGSNNFVSIGTVKTQNNAGKSSYNFIDNTLKVNTTYQYRIRIVENNRTLYSLIKSAGITGEEFPVNIAPNPSAGNYKINIPGFTGNTNMIVYNTQNRVVFNKNISVEDGLPVNVDISKFPKGIYILKMRLNDKPVSYKLIVQ